MKLSYIECSFDYIVFATCFEQLHSEHAEADTLQYDGACASDESRLSCVSHDAADDEKIVSQEATCARELECPNFDLGF